MFISLLSSTIEFYEQDPLLLASLSSDDEDKELWDAESPLVSSLVRSVTFSFPFVGRIEAVF